MIDAARLESAMNYLAETDLPYADARTAMERADIGRKRARAQAYILAGGTVVEFGLRLALVHRAAVLAADDDYIACVKLYETLRQRRQRAEIVIDVWRSVEASRRRAA